MVVRLCWVVFVLGLGIGGGLRLGGLCLVICLGLSMLVWFMGPGCW